MHILIARCTLHDALALAGATTMATGSELSRMSSGKPRAQVIPREDFLGLYTALYIGCPHIIATTLQTIHAMFKTTVYNNKR